MQLTGILPRALTCAIDEEHPGRDAPGHRDLGVLDEVGDVRYRVLCAHVTHSRLHEGRVDDWPTQQVKPDLSLQGGKRNNSAFLHVAKLEMLNKAGKER